MDVADEIYIFIGQLKTEHPEVSWRAIYDAIYHIADNYKLLEVGRAKVILGDKNETRITIEGVNG